MTILLNIYLIISTIALFTVITYVLTTKRISKLLKISVVLLLPGLIWLGIHLYKTYKNQQPFFKVVRVETAELPPEKATREPLPIEEEPLIKEYLGKIEKNRPVIIGAPREVQIQFTDPLYPESPHAVFQIVFENKGNKWARDINVLWDIKDMGQRITPPNEWSKIIGKEPEIFPLGPNQGALQIYGPEIGAYAQRNPPQIQLTVTVHYKDENGNQYTYYFKGKTLPTVYPKRRYFFEIQEVK